MIVDTGDDRTVLALFPSLRSGNLAVTFEPSLRCSRFWVLRHGRWRVVILMRVDYCTAVKRRQPFAESDHRPGMARLRFVESTQQWRGISEILHSARALAMAHLALIHGLASSKSFKTPERLEGGGTYCCWVEGKIRNMPVSPIGLAVGSTCRRHVTVLIFRKYSRRRKISLVISYLIPMNLKLLLGTVSSVRSININTSMGTVLVFKSTCQWIDPCNGNQLYVVGTSTDLPI